MLPGILSDVKEKLIGLNLLNEKQISRFVEILQPYVYDKVIYPGIFIRELNISAEVAYKTLGVLKEMGILELNYELYCHYCDQFKGEIYKSLSSIPKELYCDECGEELKPFDDTILIFRVINDGQQYK